MRFLLLFAFLLCVEYCYGLVVRSATLTEPNGSKTTVSKQDSCGFKGNSDIYGIGIRLGYYTQALSVWIANYFVLSESKTLRSVNLLFMLALFVGLIWLSHDPSGVHAVEAYLLTHLLIVTWSVGVFDKARFSRKFWRFSPAQIIVQRLTLSGIVGYDLWFWWRGLDLMQKTPCGSFIFVIVKVNLYGWFRTLAKIASAVGVIGHLLMTVGVSFQLVQHWFARPVNNTEYYHRLQKSLYQQVTHNPSKVIDVPTPNSKDGSQTATDDHIVHIAMRTPLPPSPRNSCSIQSFSEHTLPSQVPCGELNGNNAAMIPTIEDLLNAEAYLEIVLSISTSNLRPYSFRILWSSKRIAIPSSRPEWLRLSHIRQRFPNRSVLSIRPLRLWIVVTLFQHVYDQRSYPLYIYPKMLELALLSPHHKTISYSALKTIMAIRTVQVPNYVPPAAYLLPAINRFLTIVVLMLSVELCIRWNSISGMGNFGAVGQLVPAVIGIGGLVRVLWKWAFRPELGEYEEDGIGKELRKCAEIYEKIRKGKGEIATTTKAAPPVV